MTIPFEFLLAVDAFQFNSIHKYNFKENATGAVDTRTKIENNPNSFITQFFNQHLCIALWQHDPNYAARPVESKYTLNK